MLKRYAALVVVVAYIVGIGGTSLLQAQYFSTRPPEGKPSVFEYGWRGLVLGLLGGAAAGYLRFEGESSDVNENILRSTGYGALAGSVVGLGLGFWDAAAQRRGMGDIILNDMYLGGGFGTAVGTIVGGINALATSDWKYLAKGASWGYLGGILLGTIVGAFEGPRLMGEVPPAASNRLTPSAYFFADSRGLPCTGVSVRKAF